MWIVCAFGSAFFAGITAILAKCGIRRTDSTAATAVRTTRGRWSFSSSPAWPRAQAGCAILRRCSWAILIKSCRWINPA